MSKVFVNIGLSLDGYMAPEGMTTDFHVPNAPKLCSDSDPISFYVS